MHTLDAALFRAAAYADAFAAARCRAMPPPPDAMLSALPSYATMPAADAASAMLIFSSFSLHLR